MTTAPRPMHIIITTTTTTMAIKITIMTALHIGNYNSNSKNNNNYESIEFLTVQHATTTKGEYRSCIGVDMGLNRGHV